MKRSYFLTIMITLITWIALTCLWAGGIQKEVKTNTDSYNKLTCQVEKLTIQIGITNEILERLERGRK